LSVELSKLSRKWTDYFIRIINDDKNKGYFPLDKDEIRLALSLWSSLEGFLYMKDYGVFDKYDVNLESLVEEHINHLICGIQQYKEGGKP